MGIFGFFNFLLQSLVFFVDLVFALEGESITSRYVGQSVGLFCGDVLVFASFYFLDFLFQSVHFIFAVKKIDFAVLKVFEAHIWESDK